jgi:hypothetical protein
LYEEAEEDSADNDPWESGVLKQTCEDNMEISPGIPPLLKKGLLGVQ